MDEWAELDGQSQVDLAMQTSGWELEKSEVEMLLTWRGKPRPGHRCQGRGPAGADLQAAAGRNDPALKVLIFTEFVPTQAMLAGFLESRGFSVATLNGSMDLDTRTGAAGVLQDVRVLISTDAGGEGLNLQFCHVIVNFDMPWNPMRIEQRIGRVDRIGQRMWCAPSTSCSKTRWSTACARCWRKARGHRAGVRRRQGGRRDGLGRGRPIFDELFVHGLQNPDAIEQECDAVVSQLRSTWRSRRRTATCSPRTRSGRRRCPQVARPPGAVLAGARHHQRAGCARLSEGWQGMAGEVGGRQRVGTGLL
jgi:hypothetical protein